MSTAVAMVGTGEWARHGLAPALTAQHEVDIVACVAADRDQATRFASDFGVPRVYEDLDDLLAGETGLDLVVVSTPDDHHPFAVRAAVQAGVAVFCEKPLANSAGEAAELAVAVEASGTLATVGFSFRYSAAMQRLRRDLRAGRLGTPWLLEMHEHNAQFHPAVGRPLTWKGDPKHAAGGAIFEYGAHIVDLGSWLLGPVSEVSAQFASVVPSGVLDDIATVQLRYEDGPLGTLLTSWVLGGGFPGIRLKLHGSEGSAEALLGVDLDGTERYLRHDPGGRPVEDVDLTPPDASRSTYAERQLADLLALLAAQAPQYPETLPSFRDAVDVQRTLDTTLAATDRRLAVARVSRLCRGPQHGSADCWDDDAPRRPDSTSSTPGFKPVQS